MPVELIRRLVSAAEYHKMAEVGILTEEDRVELINGEIIKMSPIGSKHAACVSRLTALLIRALGDMWIVFPQNPIHLSNDSEPEPDIAVLEFKEDYYASELPKPNDVIFVAEVSDTTLAYDREIKLPLYAAAGIPVYWIIDLEARVIEVYEQPKVDTYAKRSIFQPSEKVILPKVKVSLLVEDILGKG